MSIWTALWLLWGLFFAIVEGAALFNGEKDDTLSEHVWKWFGIGRNGAHPKVTGSIRLRRFMLLAFMAWLAAHFLTGGFF